jgi:hypothetical protein
MEPDRFDDVELQVLEEPAPRGPRRSWSRWVLAVAASALTAGALAAGASALTGSSDDAARPAAKQRLHMLQGDARFHAGHPCRDHAPTSTALAPQD